MLVSNVSLINFRNYEQCRLVLSAGRNILVGENAQGKSNFLEAVELLATGRSARADKDEELIRFQCDAMTAELDFSSGGYSQSLRMSLAKGQRAGGGSAGGGARIEKQISINGVKQKSIHDLLGRLLVVSFTASDLNLLRGGPRHRRDWLDSLTLKMQPRLSETFNAYAKSLSQRNKLLKAIFERGKVTVSDQDQLLVWDKQVARSGARLIKQRLLLLSQLLPLAERQQSSISNRHESLSIRYHFKAPETSSHDQFAEDDAFEDTDIQQSSGTTSGAHNLNSTQLAAMEEAELEQTLMRLLKQRRADEIRRKQTTVGPHRDDLVVYLNDTNAVSFASQGQQRSIVLSLKLAELQLIKDAVNETPVLLLDDVLAELDEFRQSMLMSVVEEGLQTLITTTHVSGFDPRWLSGATIFKVHQGTIEKPALV